MFSFLKFLNPKSNADKNDASNNLSGKTLNLNSAEARTLNIFNHKSPIARKSSGNNTSLRNNCKETITSPGFSFRIAQRAREARPTTPNVDNVSTSYTSENSLNCSNTMNGNNATPRDTYDKKRKLMETLDNFGVKKRTRQECAADTFVNRCRRTISESNAPDRITVMNGYNHRLPQSISTVMSSKSINVENKKIKRHGDFGLNLFHNQKKPRTRNNEILSSYSSSKFLLSSGQKRPYPTDNDDESPSRKHCRSCTCCGSTVLLENDKNNQNKSDKTTETDQSDDLVTVAASRIFNRSGKTQVVKKLSMKTILDEVFDDVDLVPYTSIDKVNEKKKKAQKNVISVEDYIDKSKKDTIHSVDSITSVSSTVSSTGLITSSTPSIQSTVPLSLGLNPHESTSNTNEGNKNNTLQFSFGSSIVSTASPDEVNQKQANEVKEKATKTPETIKNTFTLKTPSPNAQNKLLFQSPENNEKITDEKSQIVAQNNNKKEPSFQFIIPATKPNEPIVNVSNVSEPKINENSTPVLQFGNQVENSLKQSTFTFGVPKSDEKQSTPVMNFGASKVDDKQSTPVLQFGAPKADGKQSTSVMQFGASKADDKQSTPVMQFGAPKADDKQSTPVMKFGAPKADDKQSTPVMKFGAPKADDKQSTPVMQFGAPKADDKQSTSIMQFGASKVDDKQSTPVLQFGTSTTKESAISTSSLFSFGNNQKSGEKQETVSVKFQFGSSKPDNESVAASSTETKNVVFGSNNLQNPNLFNFGKTDNTSLPTGNPPKYEDTIENSTPKLQFGTLPTPVFGTSNVNQSKSQFSTSVGQPTDNQATKLVFGNQISENKPTTAASGMLLTNNISNPVFQFNSSSSKQNDKTSEVLPSSTFQFSSTKTAPTFGASATQNFGNKTAYQFNTQKADESKTQFSTPSFGSQSTTTAPFKFGGNDKPVTFGSTFPSNQPLQFTNTEKPAEPFKFGSTIPSSNAFQFSSNKTDTSQGKFGQTSNTFSSSGFSGFGSSAPQQTSTFCGGVPSPQSSPFSNMTSPTVVPSFGNVVSPTSNTFGTNQGFQFGNSNNTVFNHHTSQSTKPDGAFSFNAPSTAAPPFQFGQAPSTPQFGGAPSQGAYSFGSSPMAATNAMSGSSSQPLFSMGTAPAGERRKAKAVRRRQ